MTLRMPPWEAERIANVLEYARMLTATEPKMKPWMRDCAARIKAAVEKEKELREKKWNSCSECKWLKDGMCTNIKEKVLYPQNLRCGQWRCK